MSDEARETKPTMELISCEILEMFFYSKRLLFEDSGPIFAVEYHMFTACFLQLHRTTSASGTPILKVLHVTPTSAAGQIDHRHWSV